MIESAANPPFSRRHYVLVFCIGFALWTLLSGSLAGAELLTGAIVALAVTFIFAPRLAIFSGLRLSAKTPLYIVAYLSDFCIALVRANIDLAARVLKPSLPINPALVEINTTLRSPLGRLLLANTITLTPGTLCVDVVDDKLLVHWVYRPPGTDAEQATQMIAARFEQRLARFLL